MPKKLCAVIIAAQRHWREIRERKEAICLDIKLNRKSQRDIVGMAIRKWDARNSQWRLQVLYAILVDAMSQFNGLAKHEGEFLTHDCVIY